MSNDNYTYHIILEFFYPVFTSFCQNKTAAEILLSVGSDIVEKTKSHIGSKPMTQKYAKVAKISKPLPTTVVVEGTDPDYKVDL